MGFFDRARTSSTVGQKSGDNFLATNFMLEVEGLFSGGIHSVDGLTTTHDVVQYSDNDDRVTRTRAGNKQIINCSISRDYSHTPEFRDWFKTVVDGKVFHRSVTLSSMNDQHVIQHQINVFGVWPKSFAVSGFDSRSSQHLVETLELVGHEIKYGK